MILASTAGAWLRQLLACTIALAALARAAVPDPDYVKRTNFDGALTPFYFFDDSEIVMVFDREEGTAWRSVDSGAEWTRVKDIPDNRAITMIRHRTDNEVAIVLGRRKQHWYTRDRGDTWRSFELDDHLSRQAAISFHADDSKKVILNLGLGSDGSSYYTTDGFKTEPKLLQSNSKQCMWAKEMPQMDTGSDDGDRDRILCIVPGKGLGSTAADTRLIYSDDYFKKDDGTEPPVENDRTAHGFTSLVSATKFIFAARRAEGSSEIALHVTSDGRSWHRALFGKQKLTADGFTVMHGTNYSARVDVMEGEADGFASLTPMGMLYSSNSNGTYFTKSEGYTNRNSLGLVDFEAVDNIQGVALANIVANHDQVDEGARKRIESKITFDDGRSWQDLKARRDGNDKKLHLHSYSEMRNQDKVFSNRGAPGIVIGVGNTGDSLLDYDEGDLWTSHDGGLTFTGWIPGAHKYEIGDSGAVLIAVYDEERTDEVMYSTDYGMNWYGYKLIDEDEERLRADTLTTIPDSTNMKFLMQATTGSGARIKHWVYAIDMSGKTDLPKCKNSDFETWHAREDEDGEPGCIMGHTQSFTRRKPDSKCSVSREFSEALPETEDCDCSDADFECDADYIRSDDRKSCAPVNLEKPRGACESSDDTFKGPSGFRKIPGNTCKDNKLAKEKLADVERSCKDTGSKKPAADGEITSTRTEFDAKDFLEWRYLERPSTSVDDDEEEVVLMLTSDRVAWITRDHGKHWEAINALDGEEISAIYLNPAELNDAYFITPSKLVYYTEDRGKSFDSFETPGPPTDAMGVPVLHFHEKHPKWLIWSACDGRSPMANRCSTTVHRTTKRGHNWELLLENAGLCEFVWQEKRNVSEKLVYCAEEKSGHSRRLLSSDDWFEESTTLFEDIVSYATMDEFIVVATRNEGEPDALMLNSSVDAMTFAPARFPQTMNVTHDGYTVLDSSTNSIFAHATVNGRFGQEYGNIIKSNSNGTNFVNSLNDVNRNQAGYVDFEKLLGIEGAALANVVINVDEVNDGKAKKKKTLITHNDGADWTILPVPRTSDDSQTCDNKRPACGLHLHSYTERRRPEESYSSPSAVALIMGVGNVGESLGEYRDGNTYISRDGGISFEVAKEGQYLWEFGDQGSVIVLASDKTPTDEIYYSTDEGKTFNSYKFTKGDTEVEIFDLTTIPSDGSMNFLLWAFGTDTRRRPVTYNIDFSGLFDRKCELDEDDEDKSDYYLWRPKHPMIDDDCLFGHVAAYHRKKATSETCANGPNRERLHSIERNCSCTPRDFECDYNFIRQDGICQLVGEMPDPMQICYDEPGRVEYYETIGYRRIPGDTCQGGDDQASVGSPKPCPGHGDEFEEKHGTSGVVIFFAVLLSVSGAAGLGYFVWTRYAGQFGRIQLGDTLSSTRTSFDPNSPWLRYPIMGISAIAAAAMAVPMILGGAARWASDRIGGRRRGYAGLGRTYTSRRSFARGRGDYAAVGATEDESDLLGDESDEEA